MQANKYISNKEHILLFCGFALGLFLRVIEFFDFLFFTEHQQDGGKFIMYSIFNH